MESLEQTSAVILASGTGERLGKITEAAPKPLLKFGGKPYIQYLIDWLLRKHINDVVITTYAQADQIRHFIDSRPEYDGRVSTAQEKALVGTVESTKAGLKCAKKNTCFLMTADNIWSVDLMSMYAAHANNRADATVLLTDRPGVPNLGKVTVDAHDKVVQMWPSPNPNPVMHLDGLRPGSTMGLYIVQGDAIMSVLNPQDTSIEREPMNRLIPNVQAYWNNGFFFDYGTPDNYSWLREHPDIITKNMQ